MGRGGGEKKIKKETNSVDDTMLRWFCSLNANLYVICYNCYLNRYAGLTSALTKQRPIPPKRPGVEVCHTFADLNRIAFPMVLYLGPHVANDIALLVKLIRVGRTYIVKVLVNVKFLNL